MSGQSFGGPAASGGTAPVTSSGGGGTAPPRQQRVRARRGQATDPHSIAERVCMLACHSLPTTNSISSLAFYISRT